jgi:hypothetical protein
MTAENFSYWLQGFSEICGQTPSKEQWDIIKDHLNLVFNKATPNRISNSISPTYCKFNSCSYDDLIIYNTGYNTGEQTSLEHLLTKHVGEHATGLC